MSTITEWSDDLAGRVAKYKGEEIILIGKWVIESHALAWLFNQRDGLKTVPLWQCEITHRQVDEKLCQLVKMASEIWGSGELTRSHISRALYKSTLGEAYSEEVAEELEHAARNIRDLIEEAKDLEQLTEHALFKPGVPRYEYVVQHRNNEGEWEYYWCFDEKNGPQFTDEPTLALWQTDYRGASSDASELAKLKVEYRIVRRRVGELEVVE